MSGTIGRAGRRGNGPGDPAPTAGTAGTLKPVGGSGCGRFCRHTEPAGVACETEFVRLRNAYHSQFRYVYPFDVDAPEEYDDSHYEQLDDRCWLLVEDYAVDFCGTTRDWRSWLF